LLKKLSAFSKENCSFTKILIFIMKEGKVKFFNESKGFGFIKDKSSNEEYFVHVSGLIDKIKEDDEVSFELQQGKKGLNAVNVKLL
jgi:cold shock protein